MIIYDPLWKTLEQKNLTPNYLIEHGIISKSTLTRLKSNGNVRISTLIRLCTALQCQISDVSMFILTLEDEKMMEERIRKSTRKKVKRTP